MTQRHAVVIVGGAIVGATLALLLARNARIAPAHILLLEPKVPTASRANDPYDLRVSAVSPANRAMLRELEAWQALDASRIANYERMMVWQESTPPDSPDVLQFEAAALGEPDLGSIVENRALQAALLARCAEVGIQVLGEQAGRISIDADAVTLEVGNTVVTAELVVGADGAASRVREAAGIGVRSQGYAQKAIVATVRSEHAHAHTAWQRFLTTGPLALLPLASGDSSIVWSVVEARADALLGLSPEQFNAALTTASAGVLGRLELQGERMAFPLQRLEAQRYAIDRCALVGDAAHVIHPLAGQGVNQGLQDAVALAAALAARPGRESPGARRPLQRYARERRSGNALMGGMVGGLDQLFTRQEDALVWAAREGMALVNHSALAKQFFFTRAAGQGATRSGNYKALARS
jgi:2-polyprenylphenol 6-hydroxylase